MDTQLKANLEHGIQDWVDENCGNPQFPQCVIGPHVVKLMAAAAAAVLDAIEDAQEYALEMSLLEGVGSHGSSMT